MFHRILIRYQDRREAAAFCRALVDKYIDNLATYYYCDYPCDLYEEIAEILDTETIAKTIAELKCAMIIDCDYFDPSAVIGEVDDQNYLIMVSNIIPDDLFDITLYSGKSARGDFISAEFNCGAPKLHLAD